MRVVWSLLFVFIAQLTCATTIFFEVENSALRMRAFHREDVMMAHVFHHIDLLSLSTGVSGNDYHVFAMEFALPLGFSVAVGALDVAGTATLLYQPLAYSVQSTAHYQSGVIGATREQTRPDRYGGAVSYSNDWLAVQVAGYGVADAPDQIAAAWSIIISLTEWLQIEQRSAFITIADDNYDNWWFKERLYFSGTDLFTHALRVNTRIGSGSRAVCNAFLQHSAFHTPQYALSCFTQARWSVSKQKGMRAETSAFFGIQSEYYTNQRGGVDDEWLTLHLRHKQYIGNMTLTVQAIADGYKPLYYYRSLAVVDAIPQIRLYADWGQRFDSAVVEQYGVNGDFAYDWRERAGSRARLRVTPRVAFTFGERVSLRLRAPVLYEEQDGWKEVSGVLDTTFDIFSGMRANVLFEYLFDAVGRSRHNIDVGGKLGWDMTEHFRFYFDVAVNVLPIPTLSDVEYRIGLSGKW